MRLILQRVTQAAVTVVGENGEPDSHRETGPGLMILAGFTDGDDQITCDYLAKKAVELRIFEDGEGQMNRSLLDVGGSCLIVPNFTLYASCRKGRRPAFVHAAAPAVSEPLYHYFVEAMGKQGVGFIRTGEFGAEMKVEILNDGPVTIILDSDDIMPKGAKA